MSTFLDSAVFRLADRVELRNECRSVAVTFQVSVVAWNISDEAVEHWAIGVGVGAGGGVFRTPVLGAYPPQLPVERRGDPRERAVQQGGAQLRRGEYERLAVGWGEFERVPVGAPGELHRFLDGAARGGVDAVVGHGRGELDNHPVAVEGVEAFLEVAGGSS